MGDQVWVLKNITIPNLALYSKTVQYNQKRPLNSLYRIKDPKQHIPIIWSFHTSNEAIKFTHLGIHKHDMNNFDYNDNNESYKCRFRFEKDKTWENKSFLHEILRPLNIMNNQVINEEIHECISNLVLSTQCQFCIVESVHDMNKHIDINGFIIKPYDTIVDNIDDTINKRLVEFLENNIDI